MSPSKIAAATLIAASALFACSKGDSSSAGGDTVTVPSVDTSAGMAMPDTLMMDTTAMDTAAAGDTVR